MSNLKKPIRFATAFASYEADFILGEGGSGRVYRGQDEAGRQVAIKVLDANKATKDKLKRFQNEYAFCNKTDHPNIVKVVDYGLSEAKSRPEPFFVMPRYEGSLRDLMQGSLSTEQKLKIFGKILEGMEAAHFKGVVHRDLKPENILFRNRGEEIVVADFGIARFAEDELHTLVETSPHARLANFLYAAPEQRAQGKEVDHRADIYALGLMLNELFTHTVPQGTGYRMISVPAPEVGYLDPIVEKMISHTRSGRMQSITGVKGLLIGHRNEFIARQELDTASKQVVRAAAPFGELYDNPPTIVSFDWDGSTLALAFDREIPRDWAIALQNMGSYSAPYRKDPSAFRFSGSTAYISSGANEIQSIIDHFKTWIPKAHVVYRMNLERARRVADEAERERLRREVDAARIRADVLGSIKI